MNILNENKYEQTEIFEIHKNLLNKLLPEEEILYKLRFYELTWRSIDLHLYISNKRIYIIQYAYHRDESIIFLDFNDIRGVSIGDKKYRSTKSVEIEFISEKLSTRHGGPSVDGTSYRYYRHHKLFPVKKDLQRILKIINSTIWHYGNVMKRINNIRKNHENLIPTEFKDFFYTNKITIPYKKSRFHKSCKFIELNQDFYLNCYPKKIFYKPTYLSPIRFRGKASKDYMKQLELLYLLSLYWKFRNHSLLDKEDLLKLKNKELRLNNE